MLTVIVQWTLLTRALSQTHWETAIYAEDTWHYFVGTTAPPANWKNLDFDENNWSSGLGGFGYSDGDDNTNIPNTLAVFFRKSFQVDDLDEILSAAVHSDYDDGFVAYLNGERLLDLSIWVPQDQLCPTIKPQIATMKQLCIKGVSLMYLF